MFPHFHLGLILRNLLELYHSIFVLSCVCQFSPDSAAVQRSMFGALPVQNLCSRLNPCMFLDGISFPEKKNNTEEKLVTPIWHQAWLTLYGSNCFIVQFETSDEWQIVITSTGNWHADFQQQKRFGFALCIRSNVSTHSHMQPFSPYIICCRWWNGGHHRSGWCGCCRRRRFHCCCSNHV